jgi:hypothetical protein
MDFRQDILTALRTGDSFDALMQLVRLHRMRGLSTECAYETLHQIWLEHGFNATEGEMWQDVLEAVMEKVWYGHPVL